MAAGFNGGGFSWAPITGTVIADLLNGRPLKFDMNPFRPTYFAAGGAWSNPFTAGEESRSAGIAVSLELT